MLKKKSTIRGTREWAVAEINCCNGCPHGCRYCYARYDQAERKGLVTSEQWLSCQVMPDEVDRKRPRYPGQVMFPTAHDIVPENLEACIKVIGNLLKADNRVLIVSKPHLACVDRLCSVFAGNKDNILFRFTITARTDSVLSFWEPFAPSYSERKSCLEYACDQGFSTSVSVEPMLDSTDVVPMVHELLPWVTHSIWLGKMNKIASRVVCESEEIQKEIDRVKKGQTDVKILEIYKQLSSISLVRWKESIKEIVGISPVREAGLDL